MKTYLPVLIMTVIALLIILDFFVADAPSVQWIKSSGLVLRSWGIVIAAFAMGLGAVNLLRRHTVAVSRREPEAFYIVLLLGSMLVVMVLGIASGTVTRLTTFFSCLSHNVRVDCVYIVTAAYRSFQPRFAGCSDHRIIVAR